MVNFDLSEEQKKIRAQAKDFAATHLSTARSLYDPSTAPTQWEERFRSLKPIYSAAVKAGLVQAQVPQPLGGTGGPLIDAAIVAEELYAVDPSAGLTVLGTGLGLLPIILSNNTEACKRFLPTFVSGQDTPLASLVFSEPTGSANFAEAGGSGFGTVAKEDGDSYVISGEKIWATNSSGWDDKGADVQCVLCRIPESGSDMRSQVAILTVTREDVANNDKGAYAVLSHPQTIGHTAVNGPHIRFTNLRVPKANLLVPPGKGADVVEMAFTASAALVGALSVGIMRQAFVEALDWAKVERRGGRDVMLQKQSVADLLIKIKTRLEASRALTWKAADAFGKTKFGAELCYEAKIFCSESAVECVMDAINLVGVSAYSRKSKLGYLLQDALVLPIFDGGNIGVRRRQIERIFALDDYDPLETTFGATPELNHV